MLKRRLLLLNLISILLSWTTLPFLGRSQIKRFLPATLFILLVEAIYAKIGRRLRWWRFYANSTSFFTGEFPFIIGPFFVTALWILKSSYGNLVRFLSLNAIANGVFVLQSVLFKKLKIFKTVNLNKLQFFLYFFHKAIFLYGFQYFVEKKRIAAD